MKIYIIKMENIFEKPYLGRHNDVPVYLNAGRFGPYLNYNGKLYSVSKCFQNDKFNLKTAIKIITFNEQKEKKIQEVVEKFDKKLNGVDEEVKTIPDGGEKDELDIKPKKDKKDKK
jgi:topoisomerase IA-like protein